MEYNQRYKQQQQPPREIGSIQFLSQNNQQQNYNQQDQSYDDEDPIDNFDNQWDQLRHSGGEQHRRNTERANLNMHSYNTLKERKFSKPQLFPAQQMAPEVLHEQQRELQTQKMHNRKQTLQTKHQIQQQANLLQDSYERKKLAVYSNPGRTTTSGGTHTSSNITGDFDEPNSPFSQAAQLQQEHFKRQTEQLRQNKGKIHPQLNNFVINEENSMQMDDEDDYEIPSSPVDQKRNNLNMINENLGFNRGTIRQSDQKDLKNFPGNLKSTFVSNPSPMAAKNPRVESRQPSFFYDNEADFTDNSQSHNVTTKEHTNRPDTSPLHKGQFSPSIRVNAVKISQTIPGRKSNAVSNAKVNDLKLPVSMNKSRARVQRSSQSRSPAVNMMDQSNSVVINKPYINSEAKQSHVKFQGNSMGIGSIRKFDNLQSKHTPTEFQNKFQAPDCGQQQVKSYMMNQANLMCNPEKNEEEQDIFLKNGFENQSNPSLRIRTPHLGTISNSSVQLQKNMKMTSQASEVTVTKIGTPINDFNKRNQSPQRTSVVAVQRPINKLNDLKRKQNRMSLVMTISPSRGEKNQSINVEDIDGDDLDQLDRDDEEEFMLRSGTPKTANNQTLDRSALNQSVRRLGLSADAIDMEYMEKFGQEQFHLGQEKVKQQNQRISKDQSLYQKLYDKKVQENDEKLKELQQKMIEEQMEKERIIEESKVDAEQKIQQYKQEMQLQLRQKIDQEMNERIEQINQQHRMENQELKKQIQMMEGSFNDMRTNLYKNEQIRKIQQQQIIHLKGNMRVFCRVRPYGVSEQSINTNQDSVSAQMAVSMFDQELISFPQLMDELNPKKSTKVQHQSLELNLPKQGTQVYNFDHVFLPDSNQVEIFEEIKPFVQTALDGENTCIFAYGQTGSGKTFTMEGPNSNMLYDHNQNMAFEQSGILPRMAIFIQKEIDRYQKQFNQEIYIEVSALEIYCEHIRDLLYSPSRQQQEQNKQRYVEMKTHGSKIQCIGQTWIRVNSPVEFLQQIQLSSKRRIFKNNGINPHSSRSHHVFQIRINNFDKLGKPCRSLLNIVDLAGSERRSNLYADEYNELQISHYKKKTAAPKNYKSPIQTQRDTSGKKLIKSTSQNQFLSPQSSFGKKASILEQQGTLRDNSSFNRYLSTNLMSTQQKQSTKGGAFNIRKPSASSQSKKSVQDSAFQKSLRKNDSLNSFNLGLICEPKLYDLETESKFINKNLSTLGRIFAILSNRKLQGKIAPPYRECKLTRLLQNSLQYENCKTLMIVNVCSNMKNSQATKESLEFAQKAMIAF